MKNLKMITMLFFTIISFSAHIHSSHRYPIPCLSTKIILCNKDEIASTIIREIKLAEQNQTPPSELQSYIVASKNILAVHGINSPKFKIKCEEMNVQDVTAVHGTSPCQSHAKAATKISPQSHSSHSIKPLLHESDQQTIIHPNKYLKPKTSNILESLDQQVVNHIKREEAKRFVEFNKNEPKRKAWLAEVDHNIDTQFILPFWAARSHYQFNLGTRKKIFVPSYKHPNYTICSSENDAIKCIEAYWNELLLEKLPHKNNKTKALTNYWQKLKKYDLLKKKPINA